MTLREYIKEAACKSNPGEGRGHGPRGKPIGQQGMTGEEIPHTKTAIDAAYEEGVKLALAQYLKMAAGEEISLPNLQKQVAGVGESNLKPRLTVLKPSTPPAKPAGMGSYAPGKTRAASPLAAGMSGRPGGA